MTAAAMTVVASAAALVALAAWLTRRVRDADDFAVAGRSLRATVLAGALVGAWIGTGMLPGVADGLEGAARALPALGAAGGVLLLVVLAPLVRALPAQTLPQVLGVRFGTTARRLAAAIVAGSLVVVLAWQCQAGAELAAKFFPGADPRVLRLAFGGLVIVPAFLAGMHSVALAGALCGALVLAGTLTAAGLAWNGWQAAAPGVPAGPAGVSGHLGDARAWVAALLPAFLLVVADAGVHQRFLAAEDPRAARLGALGMVAGVVLAGGALALTTVLAQGPLPGWAAALLDAAILAAVLASAGAFLLAAACAAAGDFSERLRSPLWQRAATLLAGGGALALAHFGDLGAGRVSAAWMIAAASLAPALLMAILRPLAPGGAIVAGMFGGAAGAAAWAVPELREHLPEALRDQSALVAGVAANAVFMAVAAAASAVRARL